MQSRNTLSKIKARWVANLKKRLRQKWVSRWTKNPKGQSRKKLETWIKIIILIDWKPERSIYAKIKDHDKVTASIRHTIDLGHPAIKRPSIWSICRSKTRNRENSKLSGRITVIMFNVPFTYTYHFPNFSKIHGATPLAGHHSIHQIWACAHLFGILIYSIFDGNTWSKNFQNTIFFTSFKKCEQQTHSLWTHK